MECALVLVVLTAVANTGMPADADDVPPGQSDRYKITLRRRDDAAVVQADKERTIIDIKSPFGISHAVIERLDASWPGAVVLRLRLRGLENFRISNGKEALAMTVSIPGGKPAPRVWHDGKEGAPLN